MRLSHRTAPTLILAALLPATSVAQLKPAVATFTVPVTIANMDDEALHKVIGDLQVRCQVFGSNTRFPIATGATKVDLTVTPATPTARAAANFKGNVVVVTYANSLSSGGTGQSPQSESGDQAAAQKAINNAKSYRCDLMSATTSSQGLGQGTAQGELTLEGLTSRVKGEPFKPNTPLTTTVTGPLTK